MLGSCHLPKQAMVNSFLTHAFGESVNHALLIAFA